MHNTDQNLHISLFFVDFFKKNWYNTIQNKPSPKKGESAMYKVYYKPDQSDNYYPQHQKKPEPIYVSSVGCSTPWPGYETQVMHRNLYVLHYVKSGKFIYQGEVAQGPCMFLMIAEEPQYYRATDDTPFYEQFWFVFGGPAARDILLGAGIPIKNAVYPCPYLDQAYKIFEELTAIENYAGEEDGYYMLSGLFRLLSLHAKSTLGNEKKKRSAFTKTLLDYIHQHYATSITEQDLATLVNLSVNYMHRKFYEDMKTPPITYLNRYRIRCAKSLLTETDFSIAQIAESVGFSGGNYFCRVFQKYNNGLSPSEFRKKHRYDRIP
jgi:AraC-like DNA-binding protein